jgi:hypothetical protein
MVIGKPWTFHCRRDRRYTTERPLSRGISLEQHTSLASSQPPARMCTSVTHHDPDK